ncbi:MAG: hypothetical protein PVJ36_00475 [Nitrospirota bacterium]|jgi:hypothetical protein
MGLISELRRFNEDMMSRQEYLTRIETLGQFCDAARAEQTVRLVFACLKRALGDGGARFGGLLSGPARELWDEAVGEGLGGDGEDCITVAQRAGNYPYRAAAEKAFEVIFASLREGADEEQQAEMASLLPQRLLPVFEKSKSCALDGSAGDFL